MTMHAISAPKSLYKVMPRKLTSTKNKNDSLILNCVSHFFTGKKLILLICCHEWNMASSFYTRIKIMVIWVHNMQRGKQMACNVIISLVGDTLTIKFIELKREKQSTATVRAYGSLRIFFSKLLYYRFAFNIYLKICFIFKRLSNTELKFFN